ncbi:MAG TPA: hypothetical protein VJL35_08025 [Gemmatimonadaceae bacterium]|nr:hypothetical protein [Gemmatimonadaceae bacterium]
MKAIALLLFCAAQASAQTPQRLPSELQIATVNVAIGAVTAGVWRAVTHRPVLGGAARGAAAGAAIFAGRRVITNARPAYWWIGREIAAIASSEISNAAQDRPILERATLPVGPIRIHIDRSAKRKIQPRFDLVSAIVAGVVATRDGNSFALNESLATGTLVFLSPETSDELGQSIAGVMTISDLIPDGSFPGLQSKRRVMSHELIHTTQQDFVFNAWSDAAQTAIAAKNPLMRSLTRYVDFNLTLPVQVIANSIIEYQNRPWEKEAKKLAQRTP